MLKCSLLCNWWSDNLTHSSFTGVLVTCKTEEDPFKNEGARVVTKDLPLIVYADFFDNYGLLIHQSEVGST